MCIAIGYVVTIAYVRKAFSASVSGSLMHTDTAAWFEGFSLSDYSVVPFHMIVVVGALLTLLMEEINRGTKKPSGKVWYGLGRYLYVPCAVILCCVALFLKVAF